LIVDYYRITKNLRKALGMFSEQDIKGVLTPIEKLVDDLKVRHQEAMSYFDDIDRKGPELKVNEAIIQKFEPVNQRDGFEYAFKMFTKALDAVLPAKEAEPYVDDFKFLSEKRFLIRNEYEGVSTSLRVEGKKVQELIDRYIHSTSIYKLVEKKDITNENFLKYVLSRYKTEKARTALIKNKARQVMSELSSLNPVFFEKLRERLGKIIQHNYSIVSYLADQYFIPVMRDWSSYNESLVRRGQVLLDFDVIDNWYKDLDIINRAKVGEPYAYPHLFVQLLGYMRAYFHLPYRQMEGVVKAHAGNKVPSIPHYSTINRRVNRLDIRINEKVGNDIVIAIDSTGTMSSINKQR
ncbi:MAG: transposase, partial [Nitrososphaerota archaeon]